MSLYRKCTRALTFNGPRGIRQQRRCPKMPGQRVWWRWWEEVVAAAPPIGDFPDDPPPPPGDEPGPWRNETKIVIHVFEKSSFLEKMNTNIDDS